MNKPNTRLICDKCYAPLIETGDGKLRCYSGKCGKIITNPNTLKLWNKLKAEQHE